MLTIAHLYLVFKTPCFNHPDYVNYVLREKCWLESGFNANLLKIDLNREEEGDFRVLDCGTQGGPLDDRSGPWIQTRTHGRP